MREKKEDDMVSSPFPHRHRRTIDYLFSLSMEFNNKRKRESDGCCIWQSSKLFFLSTAIIEMNLYFTFSLLFSVNRAPHASKQPLKYRQRQ
jgi:hypothetical protein